MRSAQSCLRGEVQPWMGRVRERIAVIADAVTIAVGLFCWVVWESIAFVSNAIAIGVTNHFMPDRIKTCRNLNWHILHV